MNMRKTTQRRVTKWLNAALICLLTAAISGVGSTLCALADVQKHTDEEAYFKAELVWNNDYNGDTAPVWSSEHSIVPVQNRDVSVKARNDGDEDMFVRMYLTTKWVALEAIPTSDTDQTIKEYKKVKDISSSDAKSVSNGSLYKSNLINLTQNTTDSDAKWVYDDEDGCYYYDTGTQPILPDEETGNLVATVSIDKSVGDANNDNTHHEESTELNKYVEYGAGADGSDVVYYAGVEVYVTLQAVSIPIPHTVKFVANNGETIPDQTVKHNRFAKDPNDLYPELMTNAGKVFAGWFTKSNFAKDSQFNITSTEITSDLTLYAKWVDAPYDINLTFDANGGTYTGDNPQTRRVEVNSNGAYFTDTHNTTAGDPTRENYVFMGWWTSNGDTGDDPIGDGWGQRFNFNQAYYQDQKVYAKWAPEDEVVRVTYVTKTNGDESITPSTVRTEYVTVGELATRPDNPVMQGYDFKGWFTKNGTDTSIWGSEFNFDTTTVKQDITLYAKWEDTAIQYTVSFDTNDGAPLISSQKVKEFRFATQPANPVLAGKQFAGWYTDEGTWKNNWNFGSNRVTSDVELHARWVDLNDDSVEHKVSFNTKGGTPTPATQTVKAGDWATEPSADETPTKEGYVFSGWWQDDDNAFSWGPITNDAIAYAKWIEIEDPDNVPETIQVTYDSNGGSKVGTQTIAKGATPPEPTAPTRVGYNFVGWFKDDGKQYNFDEGLDANTHLTAKWEEFSDDPEITTYHNVTFNSQDGSAVPAQSVKDGQCAAQPIPVPQKEGYVFAGWYYDEKCTNEYCFSTPVVTDVLLYAKWTTAKEAAKTTHKVWFDGNEGDPEVQLQNVKNGAFVDASQVQTPTRDGYTFAGWWSNDHDAFSWETPITQETYAKAHWVKNDDEHPDGWDTVNVTFHSNGGSKVGTQTIIEGEKAAEPTTPQREGYTFEGWFSDPELTQEWDFDDAVNENLDLYASWTENPDRTKLTVTFNSQGGTDVAPQTVLKGDLAKRPADPTKDEKTTFAGWYTDSSCTIPFDFSTQIMQNTTLYAKWESSTLPDSKKTDLTVTFLGDGGKFADGNQVKVETVKNGATVTRFDAPTKDGYTFTGWWLNDNNAFDFTMAVTNNLTVIAHWEKNDPDPIDTYLVEFLENGGTTVGDQTIASGKLAQRPDDPTRTDYTFVNWYADEGLTEEFDFDVPITKNTKVYAKWKANIEYTVSFETNYGVPLIADQKVGKDEFAKEPIDPIRAGKQFAGWYTDNNTFKNKWNFNSNAVTENVTLYAKWVDLDQTDSVKHKVSFDSRGGSVTPATQTVKDGEYATEPTGAEIPTKEGYVFRGWWKDNNNAFVWGPIHNDQTAFAKWIRITDPDNVPTTIKVTYESNGGSPVGTQVIQSGTTPPRPDDPLRLGYAFKGWFKADGTEYDFHTDLTEDTVLTAKWEELSDDPDETSYYNVTFDSKEGSAVDPQSVKQGSCAVEPSPSPTKENYVFAGWFYDEDCTEEACFSTPITHDITLYASWKTKADADSTTHKVWFDGNGGTPEVQKQDVKNASYVDKSQVTTPTREGYTFLGWWTSDKDAFSWDQKITQETLVTAHWLKNDEAHPDGYTTYVVTFHANGGSEVGPQTVVAGGVAAEPTNPVRTGYTFGGWFTDEGLTQQYNFETAVNANVDLFAKWTEVPNRETLTLTFNTNGGTEIAAQNVLKGDVATRPNDPTKGEKDVFAGWFADSACTIPFDFATPLTQSMTVYAKWQTTDTADKDKQTFDVTFKTDGGEFADGNHVKVETVKNGETVTQFDNPTKDGWTFTGWWIDNNNAYDFTMPITNDMTVTAHWTKNDPDPVTVYVVEFVENGGSAVGDQTVASGKTAIRPNDPARKGYTFVNWYKDEGLTQEFDFATAITRNTSVYAKWKPDVEFTVSFNMNYGVAQLEDQKVGKDDYAKEPVDPVRAGKTFAGWYTDNGTFQNKWNFNVNTVTEDITLHARWVDVDKADTIEHQVSFDAKGGSPTPATQTVKDGEWATEPTGDQIPTRDGYVFRGWWKDATNGFAWGPIHNDEQAYAKWIRITDPDNPPTVITVSYDSDGGSKVGAQVIESGTTPPRPDDPVKIGYKFTGWFKDDGTQYNFDADLNVDTKLTAHWEKLSDDPTVTNYYDVTFDSKGGSAVDTQSVKEGDCAVEPNPVPIKEGFVFSGWYYDEEFTEEACFSTPVTGNVTLYACWKTKEEADATTHKVFFLGNGGDPETQKQEIENGGYIDATQITEPTRDGYTFTGWWYNDKDALALDKAITQETTLTAHWLKNDDAHPDGYDKFTVTYHSNGGSAVGPQSIVAGQTAPQPSNPVRIGYTFDGWYTDEGLTNPYNFDTAVNANIDLYAKWTPLADRETLTVKFDTQGGNEIADQNVLKGDLATRPGDPVKEGDFVFAGWFNDKACTVPFDFATPITQSMTVYAKWENSNTDDKDKQEFKVTFKTDGGAFADGNQVRVETVKNGESVRDFDAPTKDGYTFIGWWIDDNNAYDFTMAITNDITVTARWAKNDPDPVTTYVVEFVENGGTSVGDQTIVAGKTAIRPTDPTRKNYTFVNWYADEGMTEEFDFTAPINANTKAYAKWKADVEYTVTFEMNYGVEQAAEQKVGKDEFAKEPVDPIRAGKTFAGWYTDNGTFANKWNFSTNPVTEDITLYARWVDVDKADTIEHKVSFDAKGGTPTPATQTVKDGEYASEPSGTEIPTREGYVFRGWWKDANNGFAWGPIHNDQQAYAKWIRITDPDNPPTTITVTYDSDGGSKVGAQVIETGTTPPRPDAPTKIGYKFLGWFDAAGTEYDFHTALNADTTFTAHWEKLSDDPEVTAYHTVTFDSKDGSPVDAQSVKHGNCAVEPAPVPTKEGYVFSGWHYDEEFTEEACFSTPITDDVTLYACWKTKDEADKTTHKVYFLGDGGEPATQKQDVANGGYVDTTQITTPTREGYTFNGWWYNDQDAFAPEKAITQETAVTAHWKKNDAEHPDGYDTYTVTYHSNGGSEVGAQSVIAGEATPKPTDPVKAGYKFEGWFTDEGLTAAYDFATAVNENIDLFAKWTPLEDRETLTVKFDTQGGNEIESQSVLKGDKAERPGDPVKGEDDVFAGWYNDKACTVPFDFGTPITQSMTIYAKWTTQADQDKQQFNVTFKTNGGAFDDGTQVKVESVNNGDTVTQFDNPTKEGWTFVGWWIDDNNAYDFTMPITNDITVYAHWAKNDPDPLTTHVVEFVENGGSPVGDQTVVDGKTAVRPTDPKRADYTFVNWYSDEGMTEEFDFSAPITKNVKAYAKWRANVEYTVTFVTNYGVKEIAAQTVGKGEFAKEPVDPIRAGKALAGWYLDDNVWNNKWNFQTNAVNEDVTLYARWVDLDDQTKITHKVSFDSKGGTPTPATQTVVDGEYATEPSGDEIPTREGYVFRGWWRDANNGFAWGKVYNDEQAFAKWIRVTDPENVPTTITVTYDSNGGSKVGAQVIESGTTPPRPDTPEKIGYEFLGWFKADGTEYDFHTDLTEDTTLTAHWQKLSDDPEVTSYYNYIFDSRGGSTVPTQSVKEGNCAIEPEPVPTMTGYVFVGWFYETTYENEVCFSTPVTNDVTVYAKWKTAKEAASTTHKVYFDGNDGTPVTQTQSVNNGAYVDASKVTTPTRDGYTFEGWWYDDDNAFVWEKPITQETHVKAHWKKNDDSHPDGYTTYVVAFHSNGGTSVGSQNVTAGEKASKPTDPIRTGYDFKGWFKDEGLTQTYDFETAVNDNMDLYAKWEENNDTEQLTVRFESQGGTTVPQQVVTKSNCAVRPADPTKTDYIFAGWYLDKNCTISFDFSTPIVKPTILWAKWEKDPTADKDKAQFTVTFKGEGGQFADGNYVKTEKVKNGATVTEFDNPTRDGYTFTGWWLDDNNAYDFSVPITNDTTVYAHWKKDDPNPATTYTVEFIENGGSAVGDQTIVKGECAKVPTEPTKVKHNFLGWYSDEDCTQLFDFNTAINADTKLYAGWEEKIEYTVSFDTNLGSPQIADQTVEKNKLATEPIEPTRAGKNFAGWYLDEDTWAEKWDFNTSTVTDNITLHARWIDIDDESVTFDVTFDAAEGSPTPATQTVKDGEYATEPTGRDVPTRTGYTFGGWWETDDTAFAWGPIHSDKTATAHWIAGENKETVNVTFNYNGGGKDRVATIAKGSYVTKPAVDPAKAGYKFLGWFTDDGNEYTFDQVVNEDLNLTAKFEEISDKEANWYNVIFDSQGGSDVEAQKVKEGQCAVEPVPSPTKENMVFAGWFYDENFTEEVVFSNVVTQDLTLYAAWKTKEESDNTSHKVWFIGNGGTPATQRQDVTNEGYVDLSQIETPTRDGYTFTGWWYSDKDAFAPEKQITQETYVTAHWKQNDAEHPDGWKTYVVTYHPNGGSAVGPQSVEEGGVAPEPTNPVKTGYKFSGWYSDEGLTSKYNFSTPVTENIDLYAKWTANSGRDKVTVSFETNGGTEVSAQTVLKGEKIKRPGDPTRGEDELFAGWYTDEACTIPFDFGNAVTSTMTLYAKWESADTPDEDKTQFQVTFKTDGGQFADGNQVRVENVPNGGTVTSFDNPTKDGYTFTGWWIDDKNAYDFTMPITNNITVTAKWTKNNPDPLTTYVVEFVENGGSPVGDQTVIAGEKAIVPDDPTRADYKFLGWYSDEGLTEKFDFGTAITRNTTVYAKWKALVEYTVSFELNNGAPQIAAQTVGKNDYAIQPADPIRAGKSFAGWFTDDGTFENEWVFNTSKVTGDTVLYAKWIDMDSSDDVSHVVSFDAKGGSPTPDSQTVKDGEYATAPTGNDVPTRDGYVFRGWWQDATNGFVWGPIHTDKVAYAKWIRVLDPDNPPTTITVSYDSNGGSPVGDQTIETGTTPPRPTDPTKVGYQFLGWYKADGTQYNFDEDLTESITLTAKWQEYSDKDSSTKFFNVKFDSKGGSAVATQKVKDGQCAVEPTPVPYQSDMVFAGWYYDEEYTEEACFSTPVTKDITLYASWKTKDEAASTTHKVWFDGDGGEPAQQRQDVENDGYVDTTALEEPTKDGYTFNGWWYNDHDAFAPEKAITQETYVKAHWVKNDDEHPDGYDKYTVTYHSNGGSAVGAQSVVSGEATPKPTDPVYVGHTFKGWFTDEALTQEYDFTTPVTSNIDLYAKWTTDSNREKFVVAFNSNGGTDVPSQTVLKGDKATQPAVPEKEGNIFAGWFTDEACTIPFDFGTPVTSAMTLHAKWVSEDSSDDEKPDFKVTFKTEGGAFDDGTQVKVETVKSGATVDEFDAPTKSGYTFTGWWIDNNNAYDFSMPILDNTTVYAHWTKNEPDPDVPTTMYIVEFVENGGSAVGDQTVASGKTAVRPTDPTYLDHTFVGWYYDEGLTEEFDFATPITRNTTVYAKWKSDIEFTVKFDVNYGAPQIADQTVGKGELAKKPADPIRSGKTFAGWYTDNKTFENAWNFSTEKVKEDVTLYAKWVDIDDADGLTHQVSFDSKGGTPTPATQTVNDGEYAEEPSGNEVPERDGYVFRGWWQDANNAFVWGPIHQDQQAFAKWIRVLDPENPPETIVVTYNSNGGSPVGAQTIEKGTTPPRPDDPTKVGYKFLGWFLDDGTQYDFHTDLTENTTLTAKWEEYGDTSPDTNFFKVTFNSNGGSAVDTQTVKDGQCAIEPVPVPTKENSVFAGWYYDAELTEEVCFSTPVTKDMTLFAAWKTKEEADATVHKVWFDGNGGEPATQKQEVKNDEYVDVTQIQTPTKDGYTFSGWWYNDHDAFAPEKAITQETYVTAHWKENDSEHPDGYDTHVVTYHSNGGSDVGPQTVCDGDKAPKPTNPIRVGYTFNGWFTDEGLTQAYDFDTAVTEDIDLYAKWTANTSRESFTVAFNTQGGSTVPSQTVLKGDTATRPANPTKGEDDVFAGWFKDADCTIPYDFATPVTGAITIYAKWENSDTPDDQKTQFKVTFKTDGGKFADGNQVKIETVKNGETVTEFDAPTKEGYTFTGWWIDNNNAYDFTMQIQSDLTVTAHWVKNEPDPDVPATTYIVEFIENGGSAVGDQTIVSGECAKRPTNPTYADHTFVDWYYDEGLTEKFDFSTPITMNTKVYAKWKSDIEYTVTFDTNNGVPPIAAQTVGKGEFAKEPADPQLGGKKFAGWYTDNGSWTNNWNFGKNKVTEDVTLYARWVDLDDETVIHKVTFDAKGGTPTPDTQYIENGAYATEPSGDQVPTRDGYVFRGWWQDANNGFAWGPITNDENPYAKWIRITDPDNPPTTVTVTYDSNGGSKVGAQVVEKGTATPKPTDPVKVGYTFEGWYTSDGKAWDFHTVVNENMTLTAKWKELEDGGDNTNYYTITFNSQGGSSVDSQKVKEGQCATEPSPAPTNQSMVFSGWFYDESCTDEYVFSTPVTGDLTLYASWKTKDEADNTTHKVWFDADGGTPAVQRQDINNGEYVNAGAVTEPTKEGYTFAGWWVSDHDAFAWENPITQETHVKAHWKKNDSSHPDGYKTYVVTYHSNGGTEVGPQTITEGDTAPKPTNPTKAGYTFVNWYTDESLTTTYNFKDPVNADIDLYAKWVANSSRDQMTVRFDTRGGSSIDSQHVYYGDTATRPEDPTKDGKTFAGWYSDIDCTIPFDFSTQIVKPTTIYAKWDEQGSSDTEFTVTFKGEGGTFEDGSYVKTESVKNGETVGEFTAPTKKGYTFGGWWIDDNNAYDFSMPINNNLTVSAHWIKGENVTTYLVEFIENGGSPVGDQTIEKGKTAKKPNDPTQDGYNFKGWYADESLSTSFNFATPINADTKVYAKWEEKVEFTVSFDSNMGSPNPADQKVEQGKLAKEPAEPTRAGKKFAGWYTDEDTWNDAWNFSTSKVSGDVTLHARWIDIDDENVTFKVSFDTQGGSPKPATQAVKDGEYATEPTAPARKGYTFSGWWKNEDTAFAWGPIHSDEEAVAHWISGENKSTVKVSFDYNGGGKDRVAVIEKGAYVPRPSIEPAKAGYNFKGWYTDEGVEFTFDEVVNADMNLTAKFEEIPDSQAKFFTVTFNSKGGSDVPAQTVKEGKCAEEPIPVPTKDGLVFCGWYLDESLTDPYFFSNAVTQDLTLYACWKTQSEADGTYHKIYFDGNGGTPNTQKLEVQNGMVPDMTQIETPTREGYTFLGWWYDDDNAFDPTRTVYQPAAVKAHWKKGEWETVIVTFHSNGGSSVGPQTIVKGQAASEPTNPTFDGYKFSGWYTKNGQTGELSEETTTGGISLFNVALAFAAGDWGQRWNFASAVNDNLDLYAKWDLADYTVSFETSGGTEIEDQTVTRGQCATQPQNPTKAGYTFGGWFADEDCTVPFNFYSPITGATTVYARWFEGENVKTYNVEFNTLGGTQISGQIVRDGDCAIEPEKPTRDGYTFGGWTSEKDDYTPFSFDVPIFCDTIVYVRWFEGDAAVHTVTFDPRGGTPGYEQYIKDGESAVKPAKDPTREGYTFGGWFRDVDGKIPFNFADAITDDLIVYAYWYEGDVQTWNVKFESNGGTSVADQIVLDGKAPIKPDNPTKDGASFLGWYKDEACTEAFNWSTDVITKDTTLYAKWQGTEETKEADATSNSGSTTANGTTPGGSASAATPGNISKTGDDLMFSPLTIALAVLCFISLFCCVMAFIVGKRRDREEDDWDDDDYYDYYEEDDFDGYNNNGGSVVGGVMFA